MNRHFVTNIRQFESQQNISCNQSSHNKLEINTHNTHFLLTVLKYWKIMHRVCAADNIKISYCK